MATALRGESAAPEFGHAIEAGLVTLTQSAGAFRAKPSAGYALNWSCRVCRGRLNAGSARSHRNVATKTIWLFRCPKISSAVSELFLTWTAQFFPHSARSQVHMCGRNKDTPQDYVKLRIGFSPNGGKKARESVELGNEEVGNAGSMRTRADNATPHLRLLSSICTRRFGVAMRSVPLTA
jgi:hypothetical protein